MIHLERGQILIEDPELVVYDATGDYEDSDLIVCAKITSPDEPFSKCEAKYIAYGNMVYSISDAKELDKAIADIDPANNLGEAVPVSDQVVSNPETPSEVTNNDPAPSATEQTPATESSPATSSEVSTPASESPVESSSSSESPAAPTTEAPNTIPPTEPLAEVPNTIPPAEPSAEVVPETPSSSSPEPLAEPIVAAPEPVAASNPAVESAPAAEVSEIN